jgi:hypothetical protein
MRAGSIAEVKPIAAIRFNLGDGVLEVAHGSTPQRTNSRWWPFEHLVVPVVVDLCGRQLGIFVTDMERGQRQRGKTNFGVDAFHRMSSSRPGISREPLRLVLPNSDARPCP